MDRDDLAVRDGGGASPLTSLVCLGMWPPRRRGQELDLLGLDQGSELGCKPFDKIFIRKERRPVRPSVGIVVELPQVHQLMQRARIIDEVAYQLLVEPALVEGGVAKLGIQPDSLRHPAD